MKIAWIIAGALALLVAVFQIAVAVSTARTECQRYRLVKRQGAIEIRFYPEAVMASVASPSSTYRGSANRSFGRLAAYIFGGNRDSEKIAMTAPVHMELAPGGSTMSFVMPERYGLDDLPRPNDSVVELRRTSAEYVAALRFGGFVSDAAIQARSEELVRALDALGIRRRGSVRFLGYNPPFQWFRRRNEVIVGVDWTE